ncbi:MAG: Proton/glutamate-aspartate symporter [Gemmatimonadaceae bacterium]|nr:Proton/glutamate-aspartate symporter [Gemmatimonadaceae bacterium]
MSLAARVFIALVLGLLAGMLVAAFPVPALTRTVAVLDPVGTLWVNAIRMTVVPLVVSLLITGVASSADARVVRDVGIRAFAAFVGLLLLAAVVGLTLVPLLFKWLHVDPATAAALRSGTVSAADAAARVQGFREWLVGIVPANPVRAAADGAMLPLVVFALAFGLALIRIANDRREVVLSFFAGVASAMLVIVRAIIALAPVGVFALMLPVASRTGTAAASALGYYLAAMVTACLSLIAILYVMARAIARVPVARFARGVFPAQAVAVSTRSSLASLPALIEGADQRLGLPVATTSVVLPLAVSTFKIGSPVVWMVAVVFLARFYGVTLAPIDYLMVSATALLTSFSVPGVPHGWLLVISPLLVTMNIPAEGIGLLIAVDAIPDIVATTLNVTADMVAVAIVARTTTPVASSRTTGRPAALPTP